MIRDKDTEEIIGDVLDVEVFGQSISGQSLVGSYGAISNAGGLSSLLQVPITTGTVNRGSSVIVHLLFCFIFGQCAFCGSDTTATEIGVIESIFSLGNDDEDDEQDKQLQKIKNKIMQKTDLKKALTDDLT